jgi:hypothetical protein
MGAIVNGSWYPAGDIVVLPCKEAKVVSAYFVNWLAGHGIARLDFDLKTPYWQLPTSYSTGIDVDYGRIADDFGGWAGEDFIPGL